MQNKDNFTNYLHMCIFITQKLIFKVETENYSADKYILPLLCLPVPHHFLLFIIEIDRLISNPNVIHLLIIFALHIHIYTCLSLSPSDFNRKVLSQPSVLDHICIITLSGQKAVLSAPTAANISQKWTWPRIHRSSQHQIQWLVAIVINIFISLYLRTNFEKMFWMHKAYSFVIVVYSTYVPKCVCFVSLWWHQM